MEAAPSPSLVIKISKRRKPSKEVTVPQDTEANALTKLETVVDKKPTAKKRSQRRKLAETTLDTDELPLAAMKPAAKKRTHRHKPSADDVPLKKKKRQVPSGKEQKASVFEDKSNF